MVVLAQLVRASDCESEGNGVVARTLPKGEIPKWKRGRFANPLGRLKSVRKFESYFLRKYLF